MEGSTSTVRTQSRQPITATLLGQPGDEEAARAISIREGEQDLGTARMDALRPFLSERNNAQPAGLDHRLVLVRVHRADGVEDRPARPDALGRRTEELELELGQRPRAPAQVRPRGEHAETG